MSKIQSLCKSMYRLIYTYKLLLIFLGSILTLTFCSPERELAKLYLEEGKGQELMILMPEYVFKTSLKEYDVEGAERMEEWMLDSILFNQSLFLKFISDSSFLDIYANSYAEELQALGFIVFTANQMDTFLQVSEPDFIINVAQIEVEEYVLPIRDEELVSEYLFYKEIDLNAVNINSWFELTRINSEEELDNEILFASHYILDDFEGNFKFFPYTGEIKYAYNIDSLIINDIYGLAGYLGRKYAGYTYDYMLNTYIYKNLPENIKPRYYFHYDRKKNSMVPVDDDRFILMD